MRKSFAFSLLAVVAMGLFSSCEKNYSCVCTDLRYNENTTTTITTKDRIEAKIECEKDNPGRGNVSHVNCVLQ
ncbi:MAG: hypothetical protein R2800_01645 [Flavipsychrobacter sp.]